MPENQRYSSEFIQRLAGHIKDAFLHTEIPDDDDSRIPSDRAFHDMACYINEKLCITE